MLDILNMLNRALLRLDKKYISGEFNDLSLYKTAGQKKSQTTKDTLLRELLLQPSFIILPVRG